MKIRAMAMTGALLAAGVGAMAAGCKDDDPATPPTTTTDAGRDGRTSTDPTNPNGDCPGPVVPSLLEWKPPTPTKANACQQDDIDAMRAFLAENPQSTNEDFKAFVQNRDTVCHDCMFGESSGATWPPFPVKDLKVSTFNIGACYALVSGKEGCGKAVQNEFDCEFVACAACTSQGDLDECRKKARTGVCAPINGQTRTECAGIAVRVDDLCGSVFDSVRVQCIAVDAPTDGGIGDAATDG